MGSFLQVGVRTLLCLTTLVGMFRPSCHGDEPLTAPVLFNTPEADRILARLQVFPRDNPWNAEITRQPVLANSRAIVAAIGAEKRLSYNLDMSFVLVPAGQPRVPLTILEHPEESDPGPYPIPENAPIENWPLDGRDLASAQAALEEGDRHVIVVDPANRQLYELYRGRRTTSGWECSSAARFDLSSNNLRPDGWTSADAAGLPIFPAIIRYDDVAGGIVRHAMRFTVQRTRRAYVAPATHFASRLTDPDLPRMGERFRLRRDFDETGFSPHALAIVKGLKTYGMMVADNGGDWRISVAPDARIQGLDDLRRIRGVDFEVVEHLPKPAP